MRVGLDVDEVIAQLHYAWISAHNKRHGSTYNLQSLPKWDDYSSPTMIALLTPKLYNDVLPYPGTKAAVDTIRRMGHEVFFVSNCGPNHEGAYAKEDWLRRWGYLDEPAGLQSGHLIPGKDKRSAPVDVLVDDYLNNVESFRGWSVLQNRVHNLTLNTNKQRITHLSDFVEMLWQRRVA
jgi:5'(3')-deoxyribonucleotidase